MFGITRSILVLLNTVFSLLNALPSGKAPARGSVPSLTITPDLASRAVTAHSGVYTAYFDAYNGTGSSKAVSFSCSGVAGCQVEPLSSTIANGQHREVTITFTTGDADPSGFVTLSASGQAIGNGTTDLDIGASMVQMVAPGPEGSATQTVHRRRPVIRAEFAVISGEMTDTGSVQLWWGGQERTSEIRRNTKFLEWEVGSADSLSVGGSKTLTVSHCLTSGICTTETRTVQLPADQKPVVDFTTMPFGSSGGGFGAPFGPGIGVNGVDIETGFSIPSYVSMGVGRSGGLTYSTRTSYPRALVATTIHLPWPTSGSYDLKAVLFDGAVRKDSLVTTSASCLTGSVRSCRVVLQADYASGTIAGGVDRRWLKVEVTVTSGGTSKATTDSVEVVLVDRRDSPYGSGWWPSGASRLYADGGDRVLVGPSGAATIYRGSGDSVYLAPPGSTTRLVKTASGWELRPRGSTAKVVFDANGRVVKSVDKSGNRDSIAYDGSGRVATLVDPIGKTITFHYGSVTQKLDSIVSLPGSSGKRTTRIVVDTATNQLRYDSLSSPAARPVIARYTYRTYGSIKGTAQIWSRAGRFGADSVTVLYDSTSSGRPIQARLLAATMNGTVPVVVYRAAELQGWKVFRTLDSLYVEITDPLGRWARSRLNRWAQSELTWDQLGTLGRSSYDDLGRSLWSEGKNGDSSRVYSDYDLFGRVARSYILRSPTDRLRLDSLVYDTLSRVVKRIDARGKVDTIGYDAAGRPTYHRDASGAISRTVYRSNGQVDSMQVAGGTAYRRISYDATWANVSSLRDESGQTLSENTLDPMGRTTLSQGKIRVRATTTTPLWQWRRSRSWFDVANRGDSSATDQTTNCNDPCAAPGSWDAAALVWTRATLDSVNRPSLIRINNDSTTLTYDRLGQVTRRQPPGGTADAVVYDLVGNVTSRITRRGDTLQTWFDLRNRPDSSRVPGYGVIHTTYGGPQDQVTRVWVTGLVDSIGGVNPDRAMVYDARGRLVADTLWTGGVPRVTKYTYDTYERPVTMINAIDTLVTRYDTLLGRPDRLIARQFGDTVSLSFDAQGRLGAQEVWHGTAGARLISALLFSETGELTQKYNTMYPTGGAAAYNAGGWQPTSAEDGTNMGVVLLPEFAKQDGSGGGTQVQKDSLTYDGRERLLAWRGMRNDTLIASENYTYDVNGNLSFGFTGTFQAGTNRLTRTVGAGSRTSAFSYDAAGNLTQRSDSIAGLHACTWTYGYDALDRLSAVRTRYSTEGITRLIARYGYDVRGSRIARRVYDVPNKCATYAAGFTRYAVQGGHVLFETDSAGSTITRRYLWGAGTDDLLAVQVGSSADSTFYPVKDKLGSIRAWTLRKDGSWRWAMRYRPYGAALDSSGTAVDAPYRWTGREYDPETGFYFLRARYYDPSVGRFTQEDPIGLAGGRNLYAYVDGQPLEARDPSGLMKDLEAFTMMLVDDGIGIEGILAFQASSGAMAAAMDLLAERYFAYVEYEKNFEANKAGHKDDPTLVVVLDGNRQIRVTTLGEAWANTQKLSPGQFNSLFGMRANDPLLTSKLGSILSGGFVGTSDFLADRWAATTGRQSRFVLGGQAGDLVTIRGSTFNSSGSRLARMAFAHEVLHTLYNTSESDICFRTERAGFGRYNQYGYSCF